MRVPLYETNEWQCDYQPRKGHVFQRGRKRILIRESGRRMTVQRTWADRAFNLHPAPYGNPFNGGEQGGGGIDLYPNYNDLARLDGTIERHAIGWWTQDGTPWDYGGLRYPLTQYEETSPTPPGTRLIRGSLARRFSPASSSRASPRT